MLVIPRTPPDNQEAFKRLCTFKQALLNLLGLNDPNFNISEEELFLIVKERIEARNLPN